MSYYNPRYFLISNWITKQISRISGTQLTLALQLDITNKCNLRCKHCYQEERNDTLTLKVSEWKNVLTQYEAVLVGLNAAPYIAICGGEPLLSPDLKPLILEIRSRWRHATIFILTNGTLLKSDDLDFYKEHKIEFQISIDGPDQQSHDMMRGKGTFNRSASAISMLLNTNIPVIIQAVLTHRTSLKIEEYFHFASSLRAPVLNFTRLILQGTAKNMQDAKIDRELLPDELHTAYLEIYTLSRRYSIKTNDQGPLYALIDPSLGRPNMFGFGGFVVDHKGNLKVSSRSDYILGNLQEKSLAELLFHHPMMKKLRKGKIEGCSDCKLFNKCGGNRNASYAATGSFLKKDPGCWA